jgi:pimeloyl-ACP methyl ester carboxylesterase
LLLFWGSVQIGANGFAHNPTDSARAVTCPTLILHGERDPRVTLEQVTALHEEFPSQATLVHIPSAEHESLAIADSERWRSAIEAFLETVAVSHR